MVNVRTTSLDQPMIQVPIYANVKHEIQVDPPLALLRTDGEKPKRVRRVRLEADPRQLLEITEAYTNKTFVSAKILPPQDAARPNIKWVELTVEGDLEAGVHDGTVTIRTNVNGAQEISLPLTVLSGDPQKMSASR